MSRGLQLPDAFLAGDAGVVGDLEGAQRVLQQLLDDTDLQARVLLLGLPDRVILLLGNELHFVGGVLHRNH